VQGGGEERRKEEADFCRIWREPIEQLEKVKGNVVPPDGGGAGALEGDDACEVDVERNMEQESVVEEDSLPADISEEQWLCATSGNESDNWTIWYTDEVRKWYKHAV
jgi:hypothetical protein